MPNLNSLFIPNVDVAVQMITTAYRNGDFDQVNRVLRTMEARDLQNVISGSADEFHNASVELSRNGMFSQAYAFLKVGIERYPKNTDLLSDALLYGQRCNTPKNELQGWYDQLKRILKRFWTWRAYQFSFDYLMATLPECETEAELDDTEREIQEIIAAFKASFKYFENQSNREKAYMMDYEFHLSRGETDEALDALKRATVDLRNNCPQCALQLADYLFEQGNYQEVVQYAKQAVGIKESQDSISKGYVYFILAESQEWIARHNNTIMQKGTLQELYRSYHSAYLYMEAGRNELMASIKKQVLALEYETHTDSGIDFDKLDEQKGNNTLAMLQQLLAQQNDD